MAELCGSGAVFHEAAVKMSAGTRGSISTMVSSHETTSVP